MKTLIIYDSVFGNTEKIALTMGEIVDEVAPVKKIGELSTIDLLGLDLLVVGSPTRAFKPTDAITQFLKSLPSGSLEGMKAAAFDTRIPLESIESNILRNMVKIGGYADKKISDLLKKKGASVLPSAGFMVTASEGPLAAGETKRAEDWIRQIVQSSQD
jgi:flavodoxin I